MINATSRPLYPHKTAGTHCIGGSVWRSAENLTPTGIRSRTVQPVASRYTHCALPTRRQALSVLGGSSSQISRQSAHEGGKVVSHMHRPPLPPGNIPGTRFC